MTPIERAARALAEEEIRERQEAFANSPWSASMSPDLEVADYIRAELKGQAPERWAKRLARVRAVLQAIREPSEGMVAAGIIERHETGVPEAWSKATANIYRSMIDAALEEG